MPPGAPGSEANISRAVVLWCFFLSGAAGLIYEVVWARQLGLFLGITSFAHTAVITSYMAGLAAGSLFFGRRADVAVSPLRLYAWLELGICVYALLTPWMFDLLQAGYAGLAGVAGIAGMGGHLARVMIAMAALLIPTFLMGGTLPLLVRGFVHQLPDLGATTSRLYGINTLGAMTGTLLAGYVLLPQFGILIATMAGVIINLGIAVYILGRLGQSHAAVRAPGQGTDQATSLLQATEADSSVSETAQILAPSTRLAVLAGFGLAGFASLLTQMAWIRAMILVVGGSVYAFTITLASFLAGIGLGSLAYQKLFSSDRLAKSQPWRLQRAAGLAALIAFSLLLGLPLIGQLPVWFLRGFERIGADNFFVFQSFIFLLSASIIIVPTLVMGALFPLVAVIWTSSNRHAAQGVGTAYAINTGGTILGALLGGLFILPLTGVHNGVQLAASIYILVALLFWWPGSTGMALPKRTLALLVVVPLFLLTAFMIPPWDRMLMASGLYYRADSMLTMLKDESLDEILADAELLYYQEGLDGTVSVKRSADGERWLAVNGKTDASSSGDLPTQVLLGQLPLQTDRVIRNAMVIGLGSGITAASVATNAMIESLTILEISDEVVEASDYFLPENYAVLTDPRVTMVTADARNFMLATNEQYDLIVSEPSNPWISGVSNLFTAEFFALAHQRLRPGGIMTQWFHTYSMSAGDFRAILGTFYAEFPFITVWRTLPGDLVIMGSDRAYALNLQSVNWQDDTDREVIELRRAGIHNDRDLIRHYLVGGEALRQFVQGAQQNTDRHPIVEFNAPRNLYADSELQNLDRLFEFLGGKDLSIPVARLIELEPGGINAHAFGVYVNNVEGIAPEIQSAHWLLAHRLYNDGSGNWGAASHRRLIWKDAGEGVYLQAEGVAGPDSEEQALALLGSLVLGELQQAGLIRIAGMTGSPEAMWSLHAEPASGRLRLGLTWACSSNKREMTRLVAAITLPPESNDTWQAELDRFSGRFSCL